MTDLDARVAEKVMGLRPCSDPIGKCDGAKMTPPRCWGTPDSTGVVHGAYLMPYSTDIAAAWLVVEKMRERGYDEILITLPSTTVTAVATKYWYAKFGNAICSAPSVPEAICRAALAAMGTD